MAKYKAKSKGYDGVKVREVGESFQFEGIPGAWMEPICGEAKKKIEDLKKAKPHLFKDESTAQKKSGKAMEGQPAEKDESKGKGPKGGSEEVI